MNSILKNDAKSLSYILENTAKEAIHYLDRIENIPISNSNKHENDFVGLPKNGIGALATLKLFKKIYEPIIVSSSGPRYWGYVTGGTTPASIMGDWLASTYDQNTQTVNGPGDNSAHIELETIGLLIDFFELPKTFFGGFVTGATMSNFTCLAVARQWLGSKFEMNIAYDGISNAKNFYVLSASAHSSAIKSLSMLGFGRKNLIKVNTINDTREAMNIADLESKIKKLNQKPFILISSAGTVNSGDFDDFEKISKLKEKYNFWWHIDAAFGAFAKSSRKHKHLLNGWENADSITIDNHKWLNVPYENATFFIKEEYKNLQFNTFQNSNAPYLDDALVNFNYLNVLPENSRRLKALPVWFTLQAYGKNGYIDIVENNIHLAEVFGDMLSQHKDFEIIAPVNLNIVAFTLKKSTDNKLERFLKLLNCRGKVFMTPTVYKNKKGIRAAFVNWRTNLKDLQIALIEMESVLSLLNQDLKSGVE